MTGVKVLIVDDDAKDAQLLADAMKTLGCEVSRASTLVLALEQVAADSFDIVVVAWDLPDGSGIDLGAKVANQSLVVVTSETGSKALADEVLGGKCADFLQKPLPSVAIVRRRLISLIERRQKDPFEVTSITHRPEAATEEGPSKRSSSSSSTNDAKAAGTKRGAPSKASSGGKKSAASSSTPPPPAKKQSPEVVRAARGDRRAIEVRVASGKRKSVAVTADATAKKKPQEDPSKTWVRNVESTGIYDPKLTVRVWTQEGYVPHIAHWDPKSDDGLLYDVEREIARGSAATVYLAKSATGVDPVALKVLDPELSHDETFRLRFRREVRSHAALTHPNVVPVLDFGRRGACYFLALELMRGSLQDVLTNVGWLPTALAAIFLEDTLHGIHFAHRRGVLHRDLKPQNLMFSDDGVVKVADFGFAKSSIDPNQSTPGLKIGTPAFFSPEQSNGSPLGPRSDLFALGSVGRVMLTGVNPYDRKSVVDTALAISKATAPHPASVTITANLHLSDVVTRLSRRLPDDRYPSGLEALKDLASLTVAIRRRYPMLQQQFMRNPVKMRRQLLEDEARLELRRARSILQKRDRVSLIRGSVALFRACNLNPLDGEAKRELAELTSAQGFIFDDGDAREKTLVKEHEADPLSRSVLEELYTRARDQGRVWSYLRYLRRYTQVAPSDSRAKRFLDEVDENTRLAPFRRDHALDDPDADDFSAEATGMHQLQSLESATTGPLRGHTPTVTTKK